MAEFEAELYLRLTGERALLEPGADDGDPVNARLDNAAHALVAVRAMTATAAQAIIDDYHLARSYRTGEYHYRHHLRAQRTASGTPAPPTLGPLRAVPCERLIEQPWGHLFLSYVVLGGDVTTLHVSMTPVLPPAGPPRPMMRSPHHARMRARPSWGPGGRTIGPGLPGQLSLTDDQGTTATGGFSGGGGDGGWRGQFEVRPPLARDTTWIEVLGERVELPGESGNAEVRVEP